MSVPVWEQHQFGGVSSVLWLCLSACVWEQHQVGGVSSVLWLCLSACVWERDILLRQTKVKHWDTKMAAVKKSRSTALCFTAVEAAQNSLLLLPMCVCVCVCREGGGGGRLCACVCVCISTQAFPYWKYLTTDDYFQKYLVLKMYNVWFAEISEICICSCPDVWAWWYAVCVCVCATADHHKRMIILEWMIWLDDASMTQWVELG